MPLTTDEIRCCLYSRLEAVEKLRYRPASGRTQVLRMVGVFICDHPARQADLAAFKKDGLPGVLCNAGTYGCTLRELAPHASG